MFTEVMSVFVVSILFLAVWQIGERIRNPHHQLRMYRIFQHVTDYERWTEQNCDRCLLGQTFSGCRIASDLSYSALHDCGAVYGTHNTAKALGSDPTEPCPFYVTRQVAAFEAPTLILAAKEEAKRRGG